MRCLTRVLFLIGFLIVSGCVPSFYPLFTGKERIFEEGLVGTWHPESKKESWVFEKKGASSYDFKFIDKKGRNGVFEVNLGRVGPYVLVDFFPEQIKDLEKLNDFYRMHLHPVHTFALLELQDHTLKLGFFEIDYVKKQLDNKPSLLNHVQSGEHWLLTASSKELQDFVLMHLEKGLVDRSRLLELKKGP